MPKRIASTTAAVVCCLALLLVFSPMQPVLARDSEDVNAEIEAERRRLAEIQKKLAAAQAELNRTKQTLSGIQGELPRLEAEIQEINATLAYNQVQTEVLTQSQLLAQLSHDERAVRRDVLLEDAYSTWRSETGLIGLFRSSKKTHPLKRDVYRSQLIEMESISIQDLAEDLNKINLQLSDFKSQNSQLSSLNTQLAQRKQVLEAQIVALRGRANNQAGAVAGLRSNAGTLQQSIKSLTEEQRRLKEYEDSIIQKPPDDGGKKPLDPGDYYFSGSGRDLYQGHGVGFSQWGAYGAAQKGWTAEKIIALYYKGTRIEKRSANISVEGKGSMTADAYVAGLAEVPDKACGTAAQAAARPDKYVVNNTSLSWDCWPEETIKAQVIVARSYAIAYNRLYGSICTTASCQVYGGGTGKKWAAEETSNQVIVSTGSTDNNKVILAVFSSDNSQGYGTANNDTVFSSMSGDGTPYSYLRAANDWGVAQNTQWTKWGWRTDGFQIKEIKDMLTFTKNDPNQTSGKRNFAASILSDVGGSVTRLDFERDPSNRVKKVIISGPKGSRAMAGWMFKGIWNIWVAKVKPHGGTDFIYSNTFALLKK